MSEKRFQIVCPSDAQRTCEAGRKAHTKKLTQQERTDFMRELLKKCTAEDGCVCLLKPLG